MSGAFTVALVGFGQDEASTMASFLRLAARRPPAYRVQDDVLDAQLLVVNADNLQSLHLVRRAHLPGRVLLLGHQDGGTGWPLLHKPVKRVDVLTALDALMAAGGTAQPRQRIRPPAAAPARPLPPPLAARRPGVLRLSDFGALDEWHLPPAAAASASHDARGSRPSRPQAGSGKALAAEPARGDLLLVADSLGDGRLLHQRFRRYGLSIDWSRDAAQSQAMLKSHRYRLVVIDRLHSAAEAYQLCRLAKQCRQPSGPAPVVVMFAPTAGSMDRMRARLAGCDAYLSRAVGETDLYRLLSQHRLLNLDAFEPTRMA